MGKLAFEMLAIFLENEKTPDERAVTARTEIRTMVNVHSAWCYWFEDILTK